MAKFKLTLCSATMKGYILFRACYHFISSIGHVIWVLDIKVCLVALDTNSPFFSFCSTFVKENIFGKDREANNGSGTEFGLTETQCLKIDLKKF